MILQKLEVWGIVILAGLLFILTMLFGWMLFIDGTIWNPVVTYESKVLETDKSIYAPGDIVYAHIEFFKSRDLVGEQKWNLVNGRILPYATRQVSMPSGVTEKWIMIEKLPQCETGEYHFEGLSTYQVNPFRTVSYKLKTKPFRIMPNNGPEHQPGDVK